MSNLYCKCNSTENLYPLHELIFNNDLENLKKLINKDNIEDLDCGGNTPLLVAIKLKRIEIIKYLLDNGANPYSRDKENFSSYFYVRGINDKYFLIYFIFRELFKKYYDARDAKAAEFSKYLYIYLIEQD